MPIITPEYNFYNWSDQNYPTIEPSLRLDFANARALDPRITFTRASVGTCVGANGLIKNVGVDEPRFDHDPTTGESLGLLIEESMTNYQTYSVDINTGKSFLTGSTLSSNVAIAPDGTTTATRITGSGIDEITRLGWNTQGTSNTQYNVFSVFVKANSGTPILGFYSNTFVAGAVAFNIDLSDGSTNTISGSGSFSSKVVAYPNGWYRVTVMGGPGTGASGSWNINLVPSLTSARGSQSGSNASASYFIWGVQEELSSGFFPTSYIPTSGSTVTRAADLPYIEGTSFSSWYNPEGGAYVLDVIAYSYSGLFFGFGTSSYLESFNISNSGGTQFYVAGNYNTSNAYTGNMNLDQSNKIGASFNSTGQRVCSNGQSVNASSFSPPATSLFTDFDRLSFGGNIPWDKTYTSQRKTHVKSFSYYPKYLSDAQLKALTQ